MKKAKVSREKHDVAWTPALIETLKDALHDMDAMLEEMIRELKSGRIPSAYAFEKTRKALLTMLENMEQASHLPLLQRFLRVNGLEIAAALEASAVSAADLIDAFEKHVNAFRDACDEAEEEASPGARRGTSSDKEPFWESSI
jgi:hypothetical protein